jgi:hypothetical protein
VLSNCEYASFKVNHTGTLFESLLQIIQPIREKFHMLLVSNQFMHIQAHGVANKPAAYAH